MFRLPFLLYMRSPVARRLPAVLAALVTTSTCSTGTRVRPSDLAMERIEAILAAHAEDRVFTLRSNPAACAVPPEEVQLDGRWFRVFLEPEDQPPLTALRAAFQAAGTRIPAHVQVIGELSSSPRKAGNLSPYPVIEVIKVCPETGCSPNEKTR